ncbi:MULTISPECIES: hypothetical protein [Thermomonospora]|uniref:NurA domain-containing protein n=1 Tax=Thermomonospora curvata (strain ATCC 19995 / DSM 43183 / JCM 3096 / KCTC 9072 / NBRC 15933 / NCIMB 10081 / Henssen B9) TaxID=471852 RepID=D1ADM5_THECD|nr:MULTISPECIES: hypothetical protein [Thermomonospora]ACY97485.1 conserved hypothetical protein [Thermomonospora curvata DSM 43183]PKK14827.1 MAG: hypothetical protein BUE48_009415 [Thermomonospora sp. CIF 1]
MTVAPAASASITIDPWDPGYATSFTAEALTELDATTAEIDLDVEVPAARWRPITPAVPAALPRSLLIVDGVRRIEARVWVSDPTGAMPTAGIAASCAAGVVRCDLDGAAPAQLAEVSVRRSLFTPSPHAAALRTWAGAYTVQPAPGAGAEQLSLALQRQLSELEVELATRHRTAGEDDLLILDGPLRGRAHLPRTIGYVKTHHTAYLSGPAASVLASLAPGQRTPVFGMGTSWRRHSWYLRLPVRSPAPWAGIARCEAGADLPAAEVIALADLSTVILPTLAGVDYKDPRAPQNLVPIGGLEKLLRHHLGDAKLLYRALRRATARPSAGPGDGVRRV